ncbi:response regulator [Sphingomonas hengshuiensis]|uniref:Sensory transduction regulatory protein n=1 Tax=Sphingomonas hengshuiensis TaxID=1609977 RepID=A0A7U4J7D2_9SPHN|nr:response regulator [Sphingomonas hengshuiensis]AJP71595.1 sensory transduction regulatory protein [Sphingomonas hengshuiensis]
MPAPSKILIVEDEPLIAMMLEDFLDALDREQAGSADTVAGALERIAEGGIDAAILDVNLRGGEQSWPIAARLAELGIPFVLATGGAGDMIAPEYRDRPILSKPFTMNGVEKALDGLAG